MSHPTRVSLNSILIGDELGHIKLVQLNASHVDDNDDEPEKFASINEEIEGQEDDGEDGVGKQTESQSRFWSPNNKLQAKTLHSFHSRNQRHQVVRILADCIQREPAPSRAISSIRPIGRVDEEHIDSTDRANNLFLITNRVGQVFVCDTDAIRAQLNYTGRYSRRHHHGDRVKLADEDDSVAPVLSPVYYNMSNKAPVCGAQPVNQTNILVVYQNGDIQHVNIGQEVLQSSLKIRRKAIRLLGLGYNSDARAVQWRVDGSTGICYFDSDAATAHLDENDPLTDIVLSSPTHKLTKKRADRSHKNQYDKSPCIKSRKYNEQERLVPTQVINMISSRTEQYKPSSRMCKWSSITSLNLIYKRLALYDLVGSENFERSQAPKKYCVTAYKLNADRLAIGGNRYALRVYDIQSKKAIYNCRTGSAKNPLFCSSKGEQVMVGGIDWLGGNKTTRRSPNLLATCSGVDSVVKVYDLRSPRPVYDIDLTHYTENRWQPYENHPRGCMFTSICASGAPYSTAVPSQQLALGSTNGQLHLIDLRFVANSHRTLGKLSGFCGGSVREIRFVSESFESSKMISCASDRFIRIHRIQTSYTSVISQKLASIIFLGSKPTCVQPVCDEITKSYLASLSSKSESESYLSSVGSTDRFQANLNLI